MLDERKKGKIVSIEIKIEVESAGSIVRVKLRFVPSDDFPFTRYARGSCSSVLILVGVFATHSPLPMLLLLWAWNAIKVKCVVQTIEFTHNRKKEEKSSSHWSPFCNACKQIHSIIRNLNTSHSFQLQAHTCTHIQKPLNNWMEWRMQADM